jgi:uncharacterized protein (TIGR04255 family)
MVVFTLPDPPAYGLSDAPLVQALAQIRYPLVADLATMEGVATLQAEIGKAFPKLRQLTSIAVNANAGGLQANGSVTWQFEDDDGRLVLVEPGQTTLSIGAQYAGHVDFFERFQQVVLALHEVKRVHIVDRIGVRFLSAAPILSGEDRQDWPSWFEPELTGWVASGVTGDRMVLGIAITEAHLAGPPPAGSPLPQNVQAVVRHGYVPAASTLPGMPEISLPESAYVLDLDLSVEETQRLDPPLLAEQVSALHGEIDRFFWWALTDTGRSHFGFEDLS